MDHTLWENTIKSKFLEAVSQWIRTTRDDRDDFEREPLSLKDALNLLSNSQLETWIQKLESKLEYTFESLKTLPPAHVFTRDIILVFKSFGKDERRLQKVQWSQEWIKRREDKSEFQNDLRGLNIQLAFNLLSNNQLKQWYSQYKN